MNADGRRIVKEVVEKITLGTVTDVTYQPLITFSGRVVIEHYSPWMWIVPLNLGRGIEEVEIDFNPNEGPVAKRIEPL